MADPLASPTLETREPLVGTNVTLYASQMAALDELAAKHRTSRSDIIRQLVGSALANSAPAEAA